MITYMYHFIYFQYDNLILISSNYFTYLSRMSGMSCVVHLGRFTRERKRMRVARVRWLLQAQPHGVLDFWRLFSADKLSGKAHELLATREKVIEGEYVEMKDAMGSKEQDKTKREKCLALTKQTFTYKYTSLNVKDKKKTGIWESRELRYVVRCTWTRLSHSAHRNEFHQGLLQHRGQGLNVAAVTLASLQNSCSRPSRHSREIRRDPIMSLW